MNTPEDDRPVMCRALPDITDELISAAVALTYGTRHTSDIAVQRHCDLQKHDPDEAHWAFLVDLDIADAAKSVWTSWMDSEKPTSIEVRADCPVTSPLRERACVIFAKHRGAHSWEMTS